MRSVTLTVTLRKRDTLRTASTPFFSTLRAIGVIRQCRFRAPDHPPLKALEISLFQGFCFEYFEYEFPALSLKLQHFQGFSFLGNFYPFFVLQTPPGIGPCAPMSNISVFNALGFSVLSTLSTFCKKHYKSGLSEQLVR